eukprot:8359894-Ditylum_brightwellii.AAC.1
MQRSNKPDINKSFEGFNIETCFSYPSEDGNQCLGWYNGIVTQIINAKQSSVEIKWNKDCIGEKDKQ